MIPKVVHYCWLSDDPVPEDLQRCMDSWKKYLPDYEFVKWDFSRFDKESSTWVSEAFDRKKYAFACDYIRLYALYHFGGIYMDMDIEVLQSFDRFLDGPYMMARERDDQMWIEAGCFGAEKGSPFLGKCLEYYEGKHFVNKDGVMEDTPLPRIMSKVYLDNGFNFSLHDWHTFTNKSYDTGVVSVTDDSFAIHHFAGSWKSPKEQAVEKRAKSIRKNVPFIGSFIAFVYEKGYKTAVTLKRGGVRELFERVKRFTKKA